MLYYKFPWHLRVRCGVTAVEFRLLERASVLFRYGVRVWTAEQCVVLFDNYWLRQNTMIWCKTDGALQEGLITHGLKLTWLKQYWKLYVKIHVKTLSHNIGVLDLFKHKSSWNRIYNASTALLICFCFSRAKKFHGLSHQFISLSFSWPQFLLGSYNYFFGLINFMINYTIHPTG